MLHPSTLPLSDKIIVVCFSLTVAATSRAFYGHVGEAAGKKLPSSASLPRFAAWYRYFQLSTIILAVGGCVYFDPVLLDLYDSRFLLYLGMVSVTVALSLFISAKLTLGPNYSHCFESYIPNSMTSAGLYRWIRHPIYSSNMLLLLGVFIMSGSCWILANLCLLFFWYRRAALQEEDELCERLTGYKVYMGQTGRFLPKVIALRSPSTRAVPKQTNKQVPPASSHLSC